MSVHVCEPNLQEVLEDPLVHLLMASDGVTDATLRNLVQAVRREQRPAHHQEITLGQAGYCAG